MPIQESILPTKFRAVPTRKMCIRDSRYSVYTQLFQWPLLAALGLLALEQLLANTRYRRVP